MDQGPETTALDPVVVTGLGSVVGTPSDPTPFLPLRKNRKFMGPQDDLAVIAAGRALDSAGLAGTPLGEQAGLYLAVGHIPFEEEDIETLFRASVEDGRFSMRRFSTEGYETVNPLLTFRCLSNMPAYHVSASFGIQGPYFVTYPGAAQFYLALEEAVVALRAGRVEVAVVAGVAHQRNFLVAHFFGRIDPPGAADRLADGAGCLVLEREDRARARSAPVRGRLVECEVSYRPHDPLHEALVPEERFDGGAPWAGDLGAASLPVALAGAGAATLEHRLASRDGFSARSLWRLAG